MHIPRCKYQLTLHLLKTPHCKQSFQNPNELSLATLENQFTNSKFPPIRRHSTNTSRSHHPKKEQVLFALNRLRNQLPIPQSNNPLQFKHTLETNLTTEIITAFLLKSV